MSFECPSSPGLPPCFSRADHPNILWKDLKGKGLPDSSSIEWLAIVSIFERSPAKKDKREIADFLCAPLHSFTRRLHLDLKRRNNGNLPHGARLIKEKRQKSMACVPSEATTTTPELEAGGAAAAEESSRPAAGAARPSRPAAGAARPTFGTAFATGPRSRTMDLHLVGVNPLFGKPEQRTKSVRKCSLCAALGL